MDYCAQDIAEVVVSSEQISQRISQLAEQITADYQDKELMIVGVLTGSFVFLADLLRKLDLPCVVDFIAANSYGTDTTSAGQIRIEKDLSVAVKGRDVLIVEDIIDTGLTLSRLVLMLSDRGAASVKVCCLLDKPARRQATVQLDYVGFQIPDQFVVGYGLDFAHHYRNLPHVVVLKPESYATVPDPQ